MKKNKFIISGLVSFFSTLVLYSQDTYKLDLSTPQTADFTRYGNLPVSKYTGAPNIDIPIYDVNTKDFKFSIGLGNNSSGFIPSKQSGPFGLNWFLKAGGVITRKVNGIPDEEYNRRIGNSSFRQHGFFYGVERQKHSSDDIINFKPIASGNILSLTKGPVVGSGGVFIGDVYEANSDEFSFNFNGMSGTFFMDNSGKIRVVSKSPNHFKVDISNLGSYSHSISNINTVPSNSKSQIIITNDDGYKYFFGGDLSSLEYSYHVGVYGKEFKHIPTLIQAINSWHLTKIKAPNGEEVNFDYMENFPRFGIDSGDRKSSDPKKPYQYILHKQALFKQDIGVIKGGNWHPNGTAISTKLDKPQITMVKTVHLKRIKVANDITISLNYSLKDHLFYDSSMLGPNPDIYKNYAFNVKSYKVDQIRVNIPGSSSYKYEFNYLYSEGKYKRLFLESIIQDEKVYDFEYRFVNDNSTNNLNAPKPDINGLDYWGFWNLENANKNIDLVPTEDIDKNGEFKGYKFGSKREPAFAGASYGLVTKITYPTKGITSIEYEPHRYKKRIEYKHANFFMPRLSTLRSQLMAGGARVKRISNYDGTKSRTRNFKYVTDYSKSNTNSTNSSGVLLQWPRYSYVYKVKRFNEIVLGKDMGSYNPVVAEGTHITYSKVYEVNSDGSYIETKFNDYESNPDGGFLEASQFIDHPDIEPSRIPYLLGGNNGSDLSIERGTENYVKTYTDKGSLVNEKQFKYNTSNSRFDKYTAEGYLGVFLINYVHRYYYSNFLTESIEKSYSVDYKGDVDLSKRVLNVVGYQYDDQYNKLVREQRFDATKGKTIFTFYRYPFSNNLSNRLTNILWNNYSTILSKMRSDNYLPIIESSVIETKDGRSDSSEIDASLTSYFEYSPGFYLPKKQFKLARTSYRELLEYNSFNSQGNPTKITQTNGASTMYLWSNSSSHLHAKIENFPEGAIPSDVQKELDVISSSPLTNGNLIDLFVIDKLRNHSFFKNSFITNYVHRPFVGLSSIRDPRNYKTSFTYDSHNRLKEVKDAAGNLVSKNKYNYKNN